MSTECSVLGGPARNMTSDLGDGIDPAFAEACCIVGEGPAVHDQLAALCGCTLLFCNIEWADKQSIVI